jgi:hypothetical protein
MHLKNCDPGHEREPCLLYDTELILGWILDDHAPVQRAEKYALDFVRERALELRIQEVWDDPCGRRAKTGQCRCNEQRD